MKNIIKKLEKEIKKFEELGKMMDECPSEDYAKYTKLEKRWMNFPIIELKTKLQTLRDVLKLIDKTGKEIGDNPESWKSHGKAGFEQLKKEIEG